MRNQLIRNFGYGTSQLWLLAACICFFPGIGAVSEQIWIPGPGNPVIRYSRDKVDIQYFGQDGWDISESTQSPIILITDSVRSHINNGQWIPKISKQSKIIAPASEKSFLANAENHWQQRFINHFHNYLCEPSNRPTRSIPVSQWVSDGQNIQFPEYNLSIKVIATPGPTKGAVSYLINHIPSHSSILVSGNVVFPEARIMPLYQYQDAIPEAGLRGYHGFAGRLASLLESLRKFQNLTFTHHISSLGPISEPQSIPMTHNKIERLYRNYLSTSALHWYFGDKFLKGSFSRLGIPGATPPAPHFSDVQNPPHWILTHGTSRIILSASGSAFLIDCGNRRVIEFIESRMKEGVIKKVEGIFVSHYHDDHSNSVAEASRVFSCPVYAMEEYRRVLENPSGFNLPCLHSNPIPDIEIRSDGEVVDWHEFRFTFHFFPGQTWYHGGQMVHLRELPEAAYFLGGDAFTPSGIDDYCLLNRNILNEGAGDRSGFGYFQCLDLLLRYNRKVPGFTKLPFYVGNQHVQPVFKLNSLRVESLKSQLRERVEILESLMVEGEPAHGLDPYWVSLYPYRQNVQAGQNVFIQPEFIRSSIPSDIKSLNLTVHLPSPLVSDHESQVISLGMDARNPKAFGIAVPQDIQPGIYPITLTVQMIGANGEVKKEVRHICEALLKID